MEENYSEKITGTLQTLKNLEENSKFTSLKDFEHLLQTSKDIAKIIKYQSFEFSESLKDTVREVESLETDVIQTYNEFLHIGASCSIEYINGKSQPEPKAFTNYELNQMNEKFLKNVILKNMVDLKELGANVSESSLNSRNTLNEFDIPSFDDKCQHKFLSCMDMNFEPTNPSPNSNYSAETSDFDRISIVGAENASNDFIYEKLSEMSENNIQINEQIQNRNTNSFVRPRSRYKSLFEDDDDDLYDEIEILDIAHGSISSQNKAQPDNDNRGSVFDGCSKSAESGDDPLKNKVLDELNIFKTPRGMNTDKFMESIGSDIDRIYVKSVEEEKKPKNIRDSAPKAPLFDENEDDFWNEILKDTDGEN